jgi:hypothetical protein
MLWRFSLLPIYINGWFGEIDLVAESHHIAAERGKELEPALSNKSTTNSATKEIFS